MYNDIQSKTIWIMAQLQQVAWPKMAANEKYIEYFYVKVSWLLLEIDILTVWCQYMIF